MERLTKRINGKVSYAPLRKGECVDIVDLCDVWGERLADYEDAEEQGLLVRLPCKVGDTVYFINRAFDSEICPAIVTKIEINLFTPEHPLWLRIAYTSKSLGTYEYHATLDFMLGKTVFLTREKAEEALKETKRNG